VGGSIVSAMATAAAHEPEPVSARPPFADASPAQVRAALVPEDAERFDREWRAVMVEATENLDLTQVHQTLESWRRVAWLTRANGPDGYRRLLARAEETVRTGRMPADSVPIEQVKAMIAERLA